MRRIPVSTLVEKRWTEWMASCRLPSLDIDELAGGSGRVVIVAPHPDDEILSMGGAISMLARGGRDIRIVAVTNGEKSHVPSRLWRGRRLAAVRVKELAEALACTGVAAAALTHLGIPDGEVARCERRLVRQLTALLLPDDSVFCTWERDGHPDHEATGRATRQACSNVGCGFVQAPVWLWERLKPGSSQFPLARTRRLLLDAEAIAAKAAALRSFKSQLTRVRGTIHTPILPPHVLLHFRRPYETFFV